MRYCASVELDLLRDGVEYRPGEVQADQTSVLLAAEMVEAAPLVYHDCRGGVLPAVV